MQFQIKQREKALEIARNRELFIWIFGFYAVAASGIVSKFVKYCLSVYHLMTFTYILDSLELNDQLCSHHSYLCHLFFFMLGI